MNLNKIIEEWVNGTDINIFDSDVMAQGYFECKKDLKTRIPQLTERIVEEIKLQETPHQPQDGYDLCRDLTVRDIIKSLTE